MSKKIVLLLMLLGSYCSLFAANYLTFTAEEERSSFGIAVNSNNANAQYSLDEGQTWHALVVGDTVILENVGDKAFLKGENPYGFSDYYRPTRFFMTGSIAASGNISSLVDGTGELDHSGPFAELFAGCSSLTQAPELPAEELKSRCYFGMFRSCTRLTKAPKLPATDLNYDCYAEMFYGCTSLTQAPELSATSLNTECYKGMFSKCTSLTKAPDLPALKLADNCYNGMFSGCTSLAQVPDLPALNLANNCYSDMFSGCTSLTQAPEIWATDVRSSFHGMFNDCVNLSSIKVHFTEWWWPDNWMVNVAPTGTFICPRGLEDVYGADAIPDGWTIEYYGELEEPVVVDKDNYLTFTARYGDINFFGIVNEGGNAPDIQYSLDEGATWIPLNAGDTVFLEKIGDKALLRGDNPDGFSKSLDSYTHFFMTDDYSSSIDVSGSVMSLIDGTGRSKTIPNDFCFYRLFRECIALSHTPELPATTLTKDCYREMFYDCYSLFEVDRNLLPAKQMTEECYRGMFKYCIQLTNTPNLPSRKLAPYCYAEMFEGCSFLVEDSDPFYMNYSLPALPAKRLARGCYERMFANCSEVRVIPNIHATEMAPRCYKEMFSGCDDLWDVSGMAVAEKLADSCYMGMFSDCPYVSVSPELSTAELAPYCYAEMFKNSGMREPAPLPAKQLAEGCYMGMFQGSRLWRSPEIHAAVTADSCYSRMFSGCQNLCEIRALFTEWPEETEDWVEGVASKGTFICPKALAVEYGTNRIPEGWEVDGKEGRANYLTFTAEEDYSSFSIYWDYSDYNLEYYIPDGQPNIEYSLDDGRTWQDLTYKTVILEKKGDKALLRGDNPSGFSQYEDNYSTFSMNGSIAASGSVMSLVDGTWDTKEIPGSYCFYNLFSACPALTQAPELPATELTAACYAGMFSGCTRLTKAPKLPATEAKGECYSSMFAGCTSLTEAPELPATKLEYYCYMNMFDGCTGLTKAPVLPATQLASDCYEQMFYGCTGLTQAPALPATQMANYCYLGMFEGCTKLARAPELPATRMAEDCYAGMFLGCTSLTEAPALPATQLARGCYNGMFYGCAGLTKAPELPATQLERYCYSIMFDSCIGLKEIPALPATNLAEGCYKGMFQECTGLTQVPVLPATKLAKSCYAEMFSGCTGLVEALGLPAMELDESCYTKMFKGCTSLTKAPELPAMELKGKCYDGMFSGCRSLREAPALPATDLDGECYFQMFENCSLLSLIKVSFTEWKKKYHLNWVRKVSSYGTFICPEELALEYGPSRIPDGWTVKYIVDGEEVLANANYLTFTAEEDSSTFYLYRHYLDYNNEPGEDLSMEYSLDNGETWRELTTSTAVVLAKKGDKAMLRNFDCCGFNTQRDYYTFGMTGSIAASGSVMSLLDDVGNRMSLPDLCFYRLFYGCTALTKAPELPATELNVDCYKEMFAGCTRLTKAPELPATKMAFGCYERMFAGCTSLTQAPALPATELSMSCYQGMFNGCTSLTKAPVLPAISLADYCYFMMFFGCTNLSQVEVDFIEWNETGSWLGNVAPIGTFICPKELAEEYGMDRIPEGWRVSVKESRANYLTFTAEEDRSYIYLGRYVMDFYNKNLSNSWPDIQYSLDNGQTWEQLTYDRSSSETISLEKKGDKVMLRGVNSDFSRKDGYYFNFRMSGRLAASGSVMSLLDGIGDSKTIPGSYCFYNLFEYCDELTQAPELPATELASHCYESMFKGCSGLTQAPALPATELAPYCYKNMFDGCTGLTQAPELPATELDPHCYDHMFYRCTGLTEMPILPAMDLAPYCYNYMFYQCSGLTQAPVLPAMELAPDCYYSMFSECTGLTQAPLFPATQMEEDCYMYMFDDCTSLTEAPALPATELACRCYCSMFSGYTSLTEAPVLPATKMADVCYSSMFSGCTSLTEAPVLPATQLASNCYSSMFYGCTSLTDAPALPATQLASNCYSSMFYGCTSLTEAPALPATQLASECCSSMFSRCTSLTQAPALPATQLASDCYNSMFYGCTSLTQAPVLPATQLAENCYRRMFYGCTSLTQAPVLPATQLAAGCYESMFYGCTGLTQAPVLPATQLAEGCYESMFSRCTNLTQAPVLPATQLANMAYSDIFDNCTNLSQIEVNFTEWDETGTMYWVYQVAPTGTFICPKSLAEEYGLSRIPEGWDVRYIEDIEEELQNANYLTFTAEEDSSTFALARFNSDNSGDDIGEDVDVQYSVDGGRTWKKLSASAPTVVLPKKGDKAMLRGYNPRDFSFDYDYYTFVMSGSIAASGSVTSLLDGKGERKSVPQNGFFKLFEGCTALTQAPELPATELGPGCYTGMFSGCTRLTQAPALPAMVAPGECYFYMFDGCTSLKQAPALPATKLEVMCYASMFYGCTSLEKAPELPADTLADDCYEAMFYGCASLKEAPALPATQMTTYCYSGMFSGCTSLTQAPELPATQLAKYCYESMFSGCTGLKQAPVLPATQLEEDCYNYMFSGCSNLSQIEVGFTEWAGTKKWVSNVAPTGTFICSKSLAEEYDESRIPEGWNVKYIEDIEEELQNANYLTFTAEEDGSTFSLARFNSDLSDDHIGDDVDVQYSLDNGRTWQQLTPSLATTVVLPKKGDKALLRGSNPSSFSSMDDYYTFVMTGSIAASGSVMSLLGETRESVPAFGFYSLFYGCTALTQAPELPSTELGVGCYAGMFSGCTRLTQAPALPATVAISACYSNMFAECTSLTQAPALPATELQSSCYENMFSGCTSLTQAPVLPATQLAKECYMGMFALCTSLTQAPVLPATQMVDYCYENMFYGCTSLTQAPVLPATQLAKGCYMGMFYGCTSLTQAPELPATQMVERCYTSMFSGCTGLTQAPLLPATQLAEKCYDYMFSGCTNLSFIEVGFTEWKGTDKWVSNVAPTGTFIRPNKLREVYGESWIPEGWQVKYIGVEVPDANYLTFTAEEDSSTFSLDRFMSEQSGSSFWDVIDVQFSLDNGGTWQRLSPSESTTVVLPKKGDKAILKGYNSWAFSSMDDYYTFVMSGSIAASGSVMSLLDGKGKSKNVPQECFYRLFYGCTALTQAPELPATELGGGCYAGMFSGCTGLTQAPELLATQIAEHCYEGMFSGCTALTQAPVLPATQLAEDCYSSMFSGCTNLSQIEVGFTEWKGTEEWVSNVAPTGTFICPKGLSEEYGESRIPVDWRVQFVGGEEETTGTESISSSSCVVWTEGRTIFVRGDEGRIEVYDLNGKLLRSAQGTEYETVRFVMPADGAYIVKTGKKIVKVVI